MKTQTVAAILFLEGLASSGVQMLMIRQVTGYVGSSVLVTSIIISVFLAALALGYFYGGKVQAGEYRKTLIRNLSFSIGLLGVGLSYPALNFAFQLLDLLTSGYPLISHPLFHLFSYSLLVLGPLVFFLGQTVPLLLNTSKANTRTSEAAGNLTALSTVGNVVGALLTALVLMVLFGVGLSIWLNCLALFAALLLCMDWRQMRVKAPLLVSSLLLVISGYLNVFLERYIFAATSEYANIAVIEHESGRAMLVNNQMASFIDDQGKAWPYIETIKKLLHQREASEILVLGSGGFTLTADASLAQHRVSYVDIDSALKQVAEDQLLQQPVRGEHNVDDARGFLLKSTQQWDVIVIDLFTSSIITVPPHTATTEFFQLVKSRLKPGGTVMMNIIADPMMQDDYSRRIDSTIRSAFTHCVTDLESYGKLLANMLYFCQKPQRQQQAQVEPYSDDLNAVSLDGYLLALKQRQVLLEAAK